MIEWIECSNIGSTIIELGVNALCSGTELHRNVVSTIQLFKIAVFIVRNVKEGNGTKRAKG